MPDIVSYNIVIDMHACVGDLRGGLRTLMDADYAGIEKTVASFAPLLHETVRQGDSHAVQVRPCTLSPPPHIDIYISGKSRRLRSSAWTALLCWRSSEPQAEVPAMGWAEYCAMATCPSGSHVSSSRQDAPILWHSMHEGRASALSWHGAGS